MERELTKKYNITLSPKDRDKAKRLSLKIFGKENVSGLFAYWINKAKE